MKTSSNLRFADKTQMIRSIKLIRKHQLASVILVLFLLTVGTFQTSKQNQLDKELFEIQHSLSTNKEVGLLYLEYCLERVTDRRHCLFSKPFFMLKKEGDDSTQDDLGREYLGTKHFRTFYQKLIERNEDVTHLHHFPEYELLVEKSIEKIKKTHKKYYAVSNHNQNIMSYFMSLFKGLGYVQIYLTILIVYFIGGAVERYVSSFNYILFLIASSISIMKLETLFFTYDSLETVSGASILSSLILGAATRARYYVEAFRIRRLKITKSIIIGILFFCLMGSYLIIYPDSVSLRAHLMSFVIGLLLMFIYEKRRSIPLGFENHYEYAKWEWLKKHQNERHFKSESIKILIKNPYLQEIKLKLLPLLTLENKDSELLREVLATWKYEKAIFFHKHSIDFIKALSHLDSLTRRSFVEEHYSKKQLSALRIEATGDMGEELISYIDCCLAYYHKGGTKTPELLLKDISKNTNHQLEKKYLKELISSEKNIHAKNFLYYLSESLIISE